MRIVPAILVVAMLLAGCQADRDDSSEETLAFTVTASGPFAVGLPLPVHPEGTTVEDWIACLELPATWTARVNATDRGTMLAIDGQGTGRITSCSQQGEGSSGYAEQYLDSAWTTTPTNATRGWAETLWVWSLGPGVHVDILYQGGSNFCGRSSTFSGNLDQGWTAIPGTEEAVCA